MVALNAQLFDERLEFLERSLFVDDVEAAGGHARIQHVDADLLCELRLLRIVFDRVQRGEGQFVVLGEVGRGEIVEVVPFGAVVEVEVVGVRDALVQTIEILGEVGRGVAVGDDEVFSYDRLDVGVDVPKLSGEHIAAQAGEFVALFAAALMEYAGDIVLLVKFEVGLLHREVGIGQQQVVEVDGIVPDDEVVADCAPALDHSLRLCGLFVAVVGRGVELRCLYRRDDDVDVVAAGHPLGDDVVIKIRERAYYLVGEVVCEAVDDLEHRAHLRAVFFVCGGTVGALAHMPRVVDAEVPIDRVGILLHHLRHIVADDGVEFFVGQAQLCGQTVVRGMHAYAADLGVVFGVFVKVLFGRNIAEHAVAPFAPIAVAVVAEVFVAVAGAVALDAAAPNALGRGLGLVRLVADFVLVDAPPAEVGVVDFVLGCERYRFKARDVGVIVADEHASEFVFQKAIDAVCKPVGAICVDEDVAVLVVGQRIAVVGDALGSGIESDRNARHELGQCVDERKSVVIARHLAQCRLQKFGVRVDPGYIWRYGDRIFAHAVLGEIEVFRLSHDVRERLFAVRRRRAHFDGLGRGAVGAGRQYERCRKDESQACGDQKFLHCVLLEVDLS